MRLLLTSSGISNRSIAKGLQKLHGKLPGEQKVVFIPTASIAEEGNKDWVIRHLLELWRYGYNWVDIVEPSSQGINWKSRMEEADIIYLTGGNTFYLLDQFRKTGLDKWLGKNVKNKIYVGSSASTIIATPKIDVAAIEPFADKNFVGLKDLKGLNWVDFEVIPHAPNWAGYEHCEKYAKTTKNKVYALDDASAILVNGKKSEVISEGAWKLYNA